eukprot:764265-Hanusia_phi.AAC.3
MGCPSLIAAVRRLSSPGAPPCTRGTERLARDEPGPGRAGPDSESRLPAAHPSRARVSAPCCPLATTAWALSSRRLRCLTYG